MKATKAQPAEAFSIITQLFPDPGVSSCHNCGPIRTSLKQVTAEFGQQVKAAIDDKRVMEIKLCRYTGSTTQVMSIWTRAQLDMLAKDAAA